MVRWARVPEPPEDQEEPPRFRTCRHRERKHAAEREHPGAARLRRRRYTWAELLRRVFGVDVLVCPECGGRRKLLTFLTGPRTIARILEHLGLPQSLPEIAPARAPPEAELPLPSC